MDINATVVPFKRDIRVKKAINLDEDISHMKKMGSENTTS